MKIVFLESGNLGDDIDLTRFQKLGDTVIYSQTAYVSLEERIQDADIIVLNKIQMNETTLKHAEKVKLICVTATGTNNIDFDYTDRRGILVRNAAGYSTQTVVQHTFAMLFYLFEKLSYYDQYVKNGSYIKSDSFTHFEKKFHDLSAATWGIVGLGAIGGRVASLAQAFGADVIYYSTSGKNHNLEFKQVDFETLLSKSDIISVHAPLNPATENLFNKEAFRKMKKSACLLNLGRGPIVNEADLYEALVGNELACAGLDVLSQEPMRADNPLYQIKDSEKLLITPHMAWASLEARERLMDIVYENIREFVSGVIK